MIRKHTCKKKAPHKELFQGLKVEKVVIPLTEEEQVCTVCGTQIVLIGEEYVRRELEFIPSTCTVIKYYSQSYGCPSYKEGLGDTEKPVIIKSQMPDALVGKVLPRLPLLHGPCIRSMTTGFPYTGRRETGNSMWLRSAVPLLPTGSSTVHRTIFSQCMISSTMSC